MSIISFRPAVLTLLLALIAGRASAGESPATNAPIVIGNTAPYTGAFAAYSVEARIEAAYFAMINERGGINGRKIDFESLDDASDPRKTLELTRELVEQKNALLIFGSFGAESNLAARDYLNAAKVPQLFVQSNAAVFNDPARYPWTMGFLPSPRTEAAAYARYILRARPNAKIAMLSAQGEVGAEFADGMRSGLGDKAASLIVKEATFRYSDAPSSIDATVAVLRESGADVFMNFAVGKTASHVVATAFDLGWHPLEFIPNGSLSIAAFLDPAGLTKATGIMANARSKGWLEDQAAGDPAVREFLTFMHKYNPQADLRDAINVSGYERAQTLVNVLERCGGDLSGPNIMRAATSLNLDLGILRPGIRITTSPTDYQPIKQLYLIRFNGKDWAPAGAVIE